MNRVRPCRVVSGARAAFLAPGRRGRVPDDAALWGWQRKPNGRWMPRGTRIGWVAGGDLFLDPAASYQVAQEVAGSERLVGQQTLRHQLRERGLLASVDAGRQMVQVRRTLELAQDWVEGSCAGRAGISVVFPSAGGSALTQDRTMLTYCRVCRASRGQAASTLTGDLVERPPISLQCRPASGKLLPPNHGGLDILGFDLH